MSKPYHESALCRYRVRAAKAVGKLPVLSPDEADALYDELTVLESTGKHTESGRRLSFLADAVYDLYLRPPEHIREHHTTLEHRDGAWYRWTLVNDIPVEFRKLDPQPEPPAR